MPTVKCSQLPRYDSHLLRSFIEQFYKVLQSIPESRILTVYHSPMNTAGLIISSERTKFDFLKFFFVGPMLEHV